MYSSQDFQYIFYTQDGKKDEREVDNSDDAASANQRRMNADPLEVMLMNMGYRITGVLDGEDDVDREGQESATPCRPSWALLAFCICTQIPQAYDVVNKQVISVSKISIKFCDTM